MKLKGVSQFEQHVEKVVLLIVCTVFLLVLSMQFLVQPNNVQIGTGPAVAPDRAFDAVELQANRVKTKLQATDIQLPVAGKAELAALKNRLESGPTAPTMKLTLGTSVEMEGSGVTEANLGKPFMRPQIPAPSVPLVHAFASTIDPFEVRDTEFLASLVPAQQPFDKRAVSIEVKYDGTALQQAFEAEDDEHRALPGGWWRGNTVVLGLLLEREELTRDGEWTNLTLVGQMPGRIDLLSEIEDLDELTADILLPIVSDAAMRAAEIQRPRYYRTIAGQDWVPPSKLDAIVERENAQVQIERIKREIRSIDVKLGAAGQDVDDDEGGGESREGLARRSDRGREDRLERQKSQEEAKIERLNESRALAVQKLIDLGFDLELGQIAGPLWDVYEFEAGPSFLDDPQRALWVHDLDVESGKTYRYRMTVVLNNPFFGRDAALTDDQVSLAASPLIHSEPSEWSEPIEVDRETYAFFVSASEGDQIGGPRATVHLFGFYYGYWRRAVAPLEPGDTVVGEARLPELQIFDLEKFEAQKPQARDLGLDPGFGPGGGDPREMDVLRRGEEVEAEDNGALLPALTRLPMRFDAFLLDVARVPGGGERTLGMANEVYQAVIRDPSGEVTVRSPDMEKASGRYGRLTQSAKAGERQGEPEPQAEEDILIIKQESGGDEHGGGGGG